MTMNNIVDNRNSGDAQGEVVAGGPQSMQSSASPMQLAPSEIQSTSADLSSESTLLEIQPVPAELEQPLPNLASESSNISDVFTGFKSDDESKDKSGSAEAPGGSSSLAKSEGGTLDLIVDDAIGQPIAGIGIKVLVKKEVVFVGKTDEHGRVTPIKNLPFGSIFEVHVKKDNGEYKFAAIGKIEGSESTANLKSPKTRFEFSTYEHAGIAGKASEHKENVVKLHNQAATSRPQITGNVQKKPEVKAERNEDGVPKAVVQYGMKDWFGRNLLGGEAPRSNAAAFDHLNQLIQFLEKQAGWRHTGESSDAIFAKMRNKTFVEPEEKDPRTSIGACNKYVKIALAFAGYGAGHIIGNNVSPARLMGSPLTTAGFSDITESLPKVKISVDDETIDQVDLLYSMPGDIIVYKKRNAPNEAGHIDVRTYHGFGSDFFWQSTRNGLPDLRKYIVTGVFRQYSDILSIIRLKSFLSIIKEKEAGGFKDPYHGFKYIPSQRPNPFVTFDDFSRHPSSAQDNKPAGAYQIKYVTFDSVTKIMGWPKSFDRMDQDRVAIFLLQGRRAGPAREFPTRTALGYIFEGKVEQAINETKLWNEWACLPGGGRQAQLTMDDVKRKFAEYINEFSK